MSGESAIAIALAAPPIGALLIALTGRWPNLRETCTLLTAVVLAVTVFSLYPAISAGERPYWELAEPLPDIALAFTVEPLGLLFACLASGLWIVNSVYSIGYMRGNGESHQTRFYVCFAIALGAVMGVAFADNLFTLFLYYEVLTLSTYPLVSHKGDKATVKSARVYITMLLFTSIGLLLPAIIWTGLAAGTLTFTPGGILAGNLQGPALGLLLMLFMFGIGKAALMPVHRWLPAAMVAPTPVSALLHAVAVVKAGVFTVVKVVIYIFGVETLFAEPGSRVLLYVATFTIITASLIAMRQDNLKRMLAYSTIAQLSYVMLAVAVLQPLSEVGAAVHMVAHAFGKITLFFAAGAIYVASKKTELSQMHGLGRRMPWTAAAFTVGALSMVGMPPTAGFVSKWFILAGSLQAHDYLAVFTLVASTVLNGLYFLPVVFLLWFRPESQPPEKDHGEAPWPMVVALTVTASLVLVFFFANGPVIELESQLVGRVK